MVEACGSVVVMDGKAHSVGLAGLPHHNDIQRLQCKGVGDHEMRRPVTATDDVFAIARHRHSARVMGDINLGHQHLVGGLPQVDLGHLAIAAHGEPEPARLSQCSVLWCPEAFTTCTA